MSEPRKAAPVHFTKAAEFIRIDGESVEFRSSHNGYAFCSFAKVPIEKRGGTITCKRCVGMVLKWTFSTRAAAKLGVTPESAKIALGLRMKPAAQRPPDSPLEVRSEDQQEESP